MRTVAVLAILCLVFPGLSLAASKVVVKGLFANKALLEIDGEARLVRAGEPAQDGVALISSTSKEAVVEINGERRVMTLNREIAGRFSAPSRQTVRIARDADSHFRVVGSINGHSVPMMIDTGATAIAMNVNDAERLGIDYRNGQPILSSTAGGVVNSFMVNLDKVSVGGITVYDVRGAVLLGDHPRQILLGNTFLSKVSMEERSGVLVLRSKF